MTINLSPRRIDAALVRLSKGLGQYKWLQSKVAAQSDFDRDPQFRRRFNSFYRVRRGPEWQDKFYRLMRRAKRERLEFRAVLHALHSATNRYEASFASKLVATLDPSKPVIDAFVLRNVGLRLPTSAAADRAGRICDVYEELIAAFSTFLSGERGHYLISAFRRTYHDARITTVKMLDLVLWQTRPLANFRSVRHGAGSKTRLTQRSRPSHCPSCGGRQVAEILYGLPAFDAKLGSKSPGRTRSTRGLLYF